MKTKAYPPILAACTLLGAPASAGASTAEVFTVSGTYGPNRAPVLGPSPVRSITMAVYFLISL
jgi:hypothetical protein